MLVSLPVENPCFVTLIFLVTLSLEQSPRNTAGRYDDAFFPVTKQVEWGGAKRARSQESARHADLRVPPRERVLGIVA